ncbi:probable 39S ribosomal protein L45, mitochondrial [Nilaparvata lugens]|uniref:probable 39S ribosomal protein L45, mitochondrial n=1 Tax=Nilaparvata lugens TaxID=108931 RepID=UPI00193C891C|nr:probable 39S ribosomal protein L45, mitochondrial [Nilaparvata lugens]
MSLSYLSRLNLCRKVAEDFLKPVYGYYSSSQRGHKHYNPKFRKFRAAKVIKVKLPDEEKLKKKAEDYTPEEIRTRMKELGIFPVYFPRERPVYLSSTSGVFEAYVPPEGDGKVSKITKEGAKQTWEFIEKKGKSMLALRKIRSFDEDFEIEDFLPMAQNTYIKSHEAMAARDKENLIQYLTERAYPEALYNIDRKTIHWKFLKSIEPPRVVHVRHTSLITKENYFAQITVRFHSQQMLAVYDRFGRLIYGSEILGKDVLEYVVFEKHLSNRYGSWRIHEKIIPDWKPPSEPGLLTYRMTADDPEQEEEEEDAKEELQKSTELSSVNTNEKSVAATESALARA